MGPEDEVLGDEDEEMWGEDDEDDDDDMWGIDDEDDDEGSDEEMLGRLFSYLRSHRRGGMRAPTRAMPRGFFGRGRGGRRGGFMARFRRRPTRRPVRRLPRGGYVRSRPPMMSAAPGLPAISMGKRLVLPFGQFAFGAATPLTWTATANPQVPMRPYRLVVNVIRNGATALTIAASVQSVLVGTRAQFIAAGLVPAEMFGPAVQDAQLVGDPAGPGVDVTFQAQIDVAPGGADTLVIQSALFCDAIA